MSDDGTHPDAAADARAARAVAELVRVMARLREPGGCPWDRAQDAASLKPYLIEEAYEVIDAIDGGEALELVAELGDLLFQVVFHARLLEERQLGDLAAVADGIVAKLTRRHPHVFGSAGATDAREAPRDEREMADRWEEHKARERAERDEGLLDSLPRGLPALTLASRMSEKAAAVGFDWPDAASVLSKVREELGELEEAMAEGSPEHQHEELGDLLFAVANLGRKLGTHPEEALRAAGAKFRHRLGFVERTLRERGSSLVDASLDEMELLWEEAKDRRS